MHRDAIRVAINGATGYIGLAAALAAVSLGDTVFSVGTRITEANSHRRKLLERMGVKPLNINSATRIEPFQLLLIATTPYQGDVEYVENLISTGLFENVIYLGSGAQMLSLEELEAETAKVNNSPGYSSYGLNKRRLSLIRGVFTVHMGFVIPDIILPISGIGLQSSTWANICDSLVLSQVKDPQRSYRISAASHVVDWLTVHSLKQASLEPKKFGYPSAELLSDEPWTREKIWQTTFDKYLYRNQSVRDSIVTAKSLYDVSARIERTRELSLRFTATDSTEDEWGHGNSHLQDVFENTFLILFSKSSLKFEEYASFEDTRVIGLVSSLFHEWFDSKFVKAEEVPEREARLRGFLEHTLGFTPREVTTVMLIAKSVSYRKRIADDTPIQQNDLKGLFRETVTEKLWQLVCDADMLEAYDLRRTFQIAAKIELEKDERFFKDHTQEEVTVAMAKRAADHIDEKLSDLKYMMYSVYAQARSAPLHAELMGKYEKLREIEKTGVGSIPEMQVLSQF